MKNFNALVLGDIHLYHPNTPSSHVVSVLYELVNDFKDFPKLDAVILEGDIFDSLMPYNAKDCQIIEKWMTDLINQCAKHDVALRVLEGTPSHDMQQSVAFAKVIENIGSDVDYRYYDDIAIEVNEEKGWVIGYVPDEMESPLSKCYDRMIKLLSEHGLTKVDIMVMHGAFNYQFPSYFEVDAYDEKLWQAIVEYFILIGHVHDRSVFGKIIASGSVDRFRHGEEKPKSITHIVIKDGKTSFKFIENTRSKLYLTYDIKFIDETILETLLSNLDKTPLGSHIRFRTQNRIDANNLVSHFQPIYPTHVFTFIIADKDKSGQEKKQLVYPTFDEYKTERINITPKTIKELMLNELTNSLNEKELVRAGELIDGHIS